MLSPNIKNNVGHLWLYACVSWPKSVPAVPFACPAACRPQHRRHRWCPWDLVAPRFGAGGGAGGHGRGDTPGAEGGSGRRWACRLGSMSHAREVWTSSNSLWNKQHLGVIWVWWNCLSISLMYFLMIAFFTTTFVDLWKVRFICCWNFLNNWWVDGCLIN